MLGERGGWESLEPRKRKSSLKRAATPNGDDSQNPDIVKDTSKAAEEDDQVRTRKTTKAGKRVRISEVGVDVEEESELSDLPEDWKPPDDDVLRNKRNKKDETATFDHTATRKSSRKR